MIESLATAFEPYAVLPREALFSVFSLVLVVGAVIIFGAAEILTRSRWNQQFRSETALYLGPVLRSHARRGRQRNKYPPQTEQ